MEKKRKEKENEARVEVKSGNTPDMRGVVSVNHFKKDDKGEFLRDENGKLILESSDKIGDIALWEQNGENPFNPDYFGNIRIMGREGKVGVFVNKTTDPRFPVLSGVVYDGGRNAIGKIALWISKLDNPRAPKYVGSITITETEMSYRVSVWTK